MIQSKNEYGPGLTHVCNLDLCVYRDGTLILLRHTKFYSFLFSGQNPNVQPFIGKLLLPVCNFEKFINVELGTVRSGKSNAVLQSSSKISYHLTMSTALETI